MKVSDFLTQIDKTSWLFLEDVVLDEEFDYLVSFNPKNIDIPKDNTDIYHIVESGDRLDVLSYKYYGTSNFLTVLFLINDGIKHPLVLEPGTTVWIPNELKIFNYIRKVREER